ncbi:MAG: hypothetical protein DHS20C03_08630 [Minwuia thermotolerans]|nr:MAG: hypothetical protein DHS20C03_08630 [Minwuia thermotolerans]
MSRKPRNRASGPRFVSIYEIELQCPAYREMTVHGRALLVEFRMIYNGSNNGSIGMSVRRAADLLNCGKNRAEAALKELQNKGWIVCTGKGSFDQKTGNRSTTWRITNQPVGLGVQTPETKDYMRWKPGKGLPEIQNTVPVRGTAGPSQGDRCIDHGLSQEDRTTRNGPSMGDRGTQERADHGPSEGDIYNLAIGGAAGGDTAGPLRVIPGGRQS